MPITLELDPRELAAVLAGLRLVQAELPRGEPYKNSTGRTRYKISLAGLQY